MLWDIFCLKVLTKGTLHVSFRKKFITSFLASKSGLSSFIADGRESVNMYTLESFGTTSDTVKRNKIELWDCENVSVLSETYFIIMHFMDWYLPMLIASRIGLSQYGWVSNIILDTAFRISNTVEKKLTSMFSTVEKQKIDYILLQVLRRFFTRKIYSI